jgi:ribosomal protein S18 acetylase RimI-like enzyme
VDITIRPWLFGDSIEELLAMGHAAWFSGHGHLFSDEENALVMASTTNDIFETSWVVPPTGLLWLAVDGRKIVGAIQLRPQQPEGEFGLIEPINVSPEYQHQGIGKKLWTMAAVLSKGRGEKGLRVWALDGNEKAIGFYADTIRGRVVDTGWLKLGTHVEPATGFQFEHPSSSS